MSWEGAFRYLPFAIRFSPLAIRLGSSVRKSVGLGDEPLLPTEKWQIAHSSATYCGAKSEERRAALP